MTWQQQQQQQQHNETFFRGLLCCSWPAITSELNHEGGMAELSLVAMQYTAAEPQSCDFEETWLVAMRCSAIHHREVCC
jgi:hypothetical protein